MKVHSYKKKKNQAFTLIELAIVIFAWIVLILAGLTVTGDYWFTRDGIMAELRLLEQDDRPVSFVDRRKFWGDTVLNVELESGRRKLYFLESNIFFSYTLIPEDYYRSGTN